MKQKVLRKLLVGTLAAMVLLGGCGAQETSSRGTSSREAGSKEERSDEVITPSTSATREETKDEAAYAGSDAMSMSSSASVSSSVASSESDSTGTERTEYSLEDCPELTKLDWDAFNEAMMTVAFGFVPDLFEWVGEDPRVDWAEVNECFDEYYGGSEGSKEFYCDMINSYLDGGKDEQLGWVYTLFIEPYHTRNENFEYDELYDKMYNEANADKIAEEEEILKGYGSYGQMLAVEGIKKYEDDLGALAKYQASMVEEYLSASYGKQLVEGASYFEIDAKLEYEYAVRSVDKYVLTAKPFMTDNGEVDYNVKDYVYFFDLVQGYLGDGVDYESIVNRDMDYIREYAENQ